VRTISWVRSDDERHRAVSFSTVQTSVDGTRTTVILSGRRAAPPEADTTR